MKKLVIFLLALITSVGMVFAAKDVVPSDAVLQNYYDPGQLCVCIFIPAEMACNDVVFVGTYNRDASDAWITDVKTLARFEPVEGYNGWYVIAVNDDTPADFQDGKGIQGKPIILDQDRVFSWSYQVGAVTKIRGGVTVVDGILDDEIDLIGYTKDAPNVFTIDALKANANPCTAVYHDYTFTVISDGCEGFAVPYLIGSMTDWGFQQMQVNVEKTQELGAPVYYYKCRCAEGTRYQVLSGLMADDGTIAAEPAWSEESYLQKLVDDVWVRIPGVSGDNQLTGTEAEILIDVRAEDLRWARCAAPEEAYEVAVSLTAPAGAPAAGVEIIGDFDNWMGTHMILKNGVYTATITATASQVFKFREAGTWDNELLIANPEAVGGWKEYPDTQFQLVWEPAAEKGKMVINLDLSNPTMYRWKETQTISGTCGDNLTWEFDAETGVLTISGNGAMADYAYNTMPWYDYRSSIKTVAISDGVTSIGILAFYGCTSLTSIAIPNSVTSIGDGAFYYCPSLTSITIPISVTSIGFQAFCTCSSLTSITIPNSVTSIGYGTFQDCPSLTSVTIGNSVTSIGEWAFASCKSLTSITIPNSVTSIGDHAFYDCSGLTSVTFEGLTPPEIGSGLLYATNNNYSIHVPCGTKEAYVAALNVNNTIVESRVKEPVIASGTCGDNLTWELSCNSVLTVSGTGAMADYTSDSNAPWHDYRSAIKTILIIDGVTSIGEWAFYSCKSLTSITIPNSVTSIGSYAFQYCSSLTSVTIPNSVTSIGGEAFRGCYILTSVTIPNSVTSIGNSAFSYCSSLTSINVDSNNPTYSSVDGVLFNKDKTTLVAYPGGKQGAYTIPNSVTSIGNHTFQGCKSLTLITIPNSVTSIEWSAFFECSSLTSVTIPNSVTSIGNQAFSYCSSLTSVTIPNSVTSIGSRAFEACSSLTSVTIPNSVTSIGSYAFYGCSSLTSVTFEGRTPPSIDRDVFYNTNNCPIYVPCGTKDAYVAALNVNNTIDESRVIEKLPYTYSVLTSDSTLGSVTITQEPTCTAPLIFRADAAEGYQFTQWSDGNTDNPRSLILTQDTTLTAEFELAQCLLASGTCGAQGDNLTWELSCDSVLTISGTGAMTDYTSASNVPWYEYRSSIQSVIITDGVKSIGIFAFRGCSSLTSITIPNSVTSIGNFAFYECSSLTSVAIGNGVTSIGKYTFQGCSSLTSVTIPNSVTSIGYRTFDGCSSLISITIPNSVTSIGEYAFQNCSSLTSVTIPNSVTNIEMCAFSGCSSLTSITIPNSVTSIGEYVFQNCSSLKSMIVESGNTVYDSRENCNAIIETATNTLIVGCPNTIIPNSVTSIGRVAFHECSSLTSITIPNSVTSIGRAAFWNCSSLTLITIPNSVTSIGRAAFDGTGIYANEDNWENDVLYINDCLISEKVSISGAYTIKAGTRIIAGGAFFHCYYLTSITIPNSVTSIGDEAFYGCRSLSSITIPNSVTSIGSEAFAWCSSLTSVTFEGRTPPSINRDVFNNTNNCLIYVPCGTKDAYVAALIEHDIDESRVIEKSPYIYSVLTSDSTLGSVTITQEPTCTAPLIFRADAAEGYQFAQWSDGNTDNPRSLILTQDTTIKAEFELCTYTVTWLNYDSLVLELDTNVIYGTMPSYDSAVPAKPSTAEYTYTFAGWSPVVESVTGHTTYIAVFDEVLNAYTVTWLNYDSLVLELDTNVAYGTMPSYDGTLPAKPSTAEYTYTFAGWSPEVVATTEDATYTATYTSALRMYSVLVYGMNDNIILNGTYPYGESVLVEAIPEQNYQFTQWSDGNTDNPRSLILTQDTILKALFEQIIIEQDTIIVTDSTDISDIIPDGQDTIPYIEVQPDGEITIDITDVRIGVITIVTIGTESGQVHPGFGGNYDNLKNTRVVMEYVLNPFGQTASPDKWYAFAVPFKVDMETGITRKYGNKSHVPGKDFMILEYDSELRSRTGSGWKEKKSGLLEPGHFYMLGIEGNCNRWLFEKVRNADVVGDKEKDLQHYAHGNSKNNGWHGLGNTTLEYVDMSFDGLNATYVYTYDNQYGRYNIYSIEELILAVGQPFFTQGDNDGSVAFTPNNGKGKGNGKKNMPIYAPSYDVQPSHPRVLLTIETEKINATPDRLYITLHDDNQCGSYRIGRDFMRMDKGSKQVPNFWCPMADGTQLSAHGISMPTTYTTIPLGIFTPAKGEYTINAHMQDMDDYIVELYYQNVCLGIVMQGVPFRLEMAAGTSYDYSIRISRRVSTDLNPAEDTQCDKDNKWYDVLGRPLPQDAHGIFIRKGEKLIK